ncbi:hypothetical protein CRG98_007580 [Punica granatum]|uniref:Transposase MuDR plant domain-containing protein n=1 Tax=Punica granatum TaxID=22663 RepID=A0A2I0KU83_PUNGR|nr:hypothetical protein CRG98_007580 [Punica granatum]
MGTHTQLFCAQTITPGLWLATSSSLGHQRRQIPVAQPHPGFGSKNQTIICSVKFESERETGQGRDPPRAVKCHGHNLTHGLGLFLGLSHLGGEARGDICCCVLDLPECGVVALVFKCFRLFGLVEGVYVSRIIEHPASRQSNNDEVCEEDNLGEYDVDGQEDHFEYEGTEDVGRMSWKKHVDPKYIFIDDEGDDQPGWASNDAEGHLGEEEEHLGDGSYSKNGEHMLVRLAPTIANMIISSDEEECYISKELLDNRISDDNKSEDELRKYPEFDEKATVGEVQVELHMLFPNLNMFKKDVTDYNIAIGRVFRFVKNDNERARAKCRS